MVLWSADRVSGDVMEGLIRGEIEARVQSSVKKIQQPHTVIDDTHNSPTTGFNAYKKYFFTTGRSADVPPKFRRSSAEVPLKFRRSSVDLFGSNIIVSMVADRYGRPQRL